MQGDVVLPPSSRCPKWEGTVIQDFLRVVRRPRYGIAVPGTFRQMPLDDLLEHRALKNFSEWILEIRSPGGVLHELCIGWSRPRNSWVLWSHCDNGRGRTSQAAPFFSLVLDRRTTPPVRRAATNYAQKIILEDARRVLDS